jgi:predicted HTH transcriptional regulator
MFNPFGKNLADIIENDLQGLLTVGEGWYIEYKSAVPDSKKIAKSIASFSNSYGGLYILGVESDKNTNCAVSFPGIDIKIDLLTRQYSSRLSN